MNLNQRNRHPLTTNVYQSDFIEESTFITLIDCKRCLAANENDICEQQTPDDILLRMERLRMLASSRRPQEYNSHRQQFSFCF
ncbi:hypothetical protein [Paraglaciecola sp.]|uniref:hypothetical protein n=1 Tax=Paraglaciecola sp. TaxID=1920173 RepID=UPI0030F427DA